MAGDHDHHHHQQEGTTGQNHPTAALSPELRTLLVKEMQMLRSGMADVSGHLATADWASIADIAKKMKDGFILRKSISERQVHELHRALPPEFIKIDMRFHETAGKLAHAAERKDGELAFFYYTRMLDTCMSCHSQFAAPRFPGYAKAKPAVDHQPPLNWPAGRMARHIQAGRECSTRSGLRFPMNRVSRFPISALINPT